MACKEARAESIARSNAQPDKRVALTLMIGRVKECFIQFSGWATPRVDVTCPKFNRLMGVTGSYSTDETLLRKAAGCGSLHPGYIQG